MGQAVCQPDTRRWSSVPGGVRRGAASPWLPVSLSRADIERLRSHLESIHVGIKHAVYEPDGSITHVNFPTSRVISLVIYLEDGSSVEMATIGLEGMVGLPIFLGSCTMPTLGDS
jgi:hypothetical protein